MEMRGEGGDDMQVRQFRQILLWPLQLMAVDERRAIELCAQRLASPDDDNPWTERANAFDDEATRFQERHYHEFVTFLPSVQRFLYGEGASGGQPACASPLRAFRRDDVARLYVQLRADTEPFEIEVRRVDLYLFHGIDVLTLAIEVYGENLSLPTVQDFLHRFGRSHPTQWEGDSQGLHCPSRVEWRSRDGRTLAASDYERREPYLAHVARYRAPRLAAHWDWLLRPLVDHHSDAPGEARYRLIEYHRMPMMVLLAVDRPQKLSRGDFMRLATASAAGDPGIEPQCGIALDDFELRYCCDRYWQPQKLDDPGSRYLCTGQVFCVVGAAEDPYLLHREHGLVKQFRHQYFLLFLIAHFHKAALLMMSDRLVDAMNHLDIQQPESVKRFKRKIRKLKEVFLSFTHRYWFHEISHQPIAKELYARCTQQLGTDALYGEVRDEIEAMDDYLDSDSLRRQANTVVRLTVVTVFGLIGTVATGFLGMNLLSEAEAPMWRRLGLFAIVMLLSVGLTFYTITKSKKLSDFLDAVSDERLSARAKWRALLAVWWPR